MYSLIYEDVFYHLLLGKVLLLHAHFSELEMLFYRDIFLALGSLLFSQPPAVSVQTVPNDTTLPISILYKLTLIFFPFQIFVEYKGRRSMKIYQQQIYYISRQTHSSTVDGEDDGR